MFNAILFLLLIQFSFSQNPFEGYTLFNPLTEGPTGGGENYTRLIDNDGNIINQWQHDKCAATAPYLLPDSTLICPFKADDPFMVGSAYGGKIIHYNWDGEIIWEYEYSDENHLQHHDIEPMPNGNILLVAWDRKTYLEVLNSGRQNVEGEMWPDEIIEIEPIGSDSANIVWEWRFWDHIIQDVDPNLPNYGVISEHPERININIGEMPLLALGYADWTHINSVDYNEELDQIILSSRNLNEIYVIDHSTTTEEASGHSGGNSGMGGDILYRWGNPMNYGRGTIDDKVFTGQHDANWIEFGSPGAGNIIIFNNGATSGFGGGYGVQSSIIEINPPMDSNGNYLLNNIDPFGPAVPYWSFVSNSFSPFMSGTRRLPNGNTLITVATEMKIFEISDNGHTVWEYNHSELGHNSISKSFKYSLDYLVQDSGILGDSNNDYNTDILDLIIIVNFILDSSSEIEISQSDMDQNGEISINDVIILLSIIISGSFID